ncbi:MAG: hypothetical protein KDM81_13465, partial [Verrucomicrobiae bacterium]|nr:hypothetical protein [Verrucomicrobiae bacterium]
AQSLTNNPVDFIALKWAFWRRVTAGETSVPELDDLAGTLAPLVHRILALPADRFWDDEVAMFPGVTDRLLRSRQEVFWLRLLEALRRQEFPEALDLLRHHPFTLHSWAPELERALLRLLALRQLDTLNPVGLPPFPPDRSLTNLHSFFARLESAAAAETPATEGAPRARTFWDRPQAVALTWVAAGWLRAGLHLVPDPVHPGELEPADAYTWAQALRYSEGPEPALAFLQARPAGSVRSPELTLLQGELLLAVGRLEEAVALLEPLATGEFTAGIHAAWLLGTLAVDQSQPARAAAVLDANPAFAASVPGRELAARVALLNQDTNTARTLYTELAADSIEGRMFRAREAFAQADWASARQLIEDLLVDVPDSIQLRSDLETIRQAEAGTAP